MNKLVLLVDDDRLPMIFYVRALQKGGFKVEQCFEPDSAIDFIQKNASQIDLIILDIMLPAGRVYAGKNTNEGLVTGVFLIEDIRKYRQEVPVIVFTNVRNTKTLSKFEEGPLLRIVQKTNCPPFELLELVDEITKRNKNKSDSRER